MAKSNTKLNSLLSFEKEVQNKWEETKIFEEDAPDYKAYDL
jgi:hypothetical protein